MAIPKWRLALTVGAIVILAVVGVGLVAASSAAPSTPTGQAAAAASAGPGASAATLVPGDQLRHRFGRAIAERLLARRLVHATITVTGQNGALITFQLDHGSITAIGSGSIAISEAGGGSVTVATDGSTVVFLGGGAGRGSLSDLKVGDVIFVQSRLDGGTALAKHILRVPATTGS